MTDREIQAHRRAWRVLRRIDRIEAAVSLAHSVSVAAAVGALVGLALAALR